MKPHHDMRASCYVECMPRCCRNCQTGFPEMCFSFNPRSTTLQHKSYRIDCPLRMTAFVSASSVSCTFLIIDRTITWQPADCRLLSSSSSSSSTIGDVAIVNVCEAWTACRLIGRRTAELTYTVRYRMVVCSTSCFGQ